VGAAGGRYAAAGESSALGVYYSCRKGVAWCLPKGSYLMYSGGSRVKHMLQEDET
jgi:hypothetical protein